jgi:nitrogen fixation/metabolism regulation signal transduction histidine kinase
MRISKFQLKLTLIFWLVLLVPAVTATLLTRYFLMIETNVMKMDQKAEAVLQDTSVIAEDIIEKGKEECLFIAQALSDDPVMAQALSDDLPKKGRTFTASAEKIQQLVKSIIPPGHILEVAIFKISNPITPGTIVFSTSLESLDNKMALEPIQDKLKAQTPLSYQEGEMVYGIAPIFSNGKIIASVVVYKQLEEGLVRNIIDLQNLLKAYSLRGDINYYLWVFVILLIIVMAILGTILATFIARSVTKPILDLVAGTKEISKGNLDYKVEAKGKDEIATLIESFNTMASQLKSSRERLMITERLAAWRNVARQIAHEIKNMLSPIQLSMYRLKKNLGSERYNEIFEQSYTSIINEVENLKNMITEFSNFARMPKPRKVPSSINEITQNAVNLYTGLPENIEIKVDLAENIPQLMADSDQMRQVLHNLIGNAVEAMPTGGKISVTTHLETDENIVMEITDTGCGMSEEVMQKIFTPYFTTKEKGTGLGMAIVAQIIEEHGGSISVESTQGVGTKVIVKLKAGISNETLMEGNC